MNYSFFIFRRDLAEFRSPISPMLNRISYLASESKILAVAHSRLPAEHFPALTSLFYFSGLSRFPNFCTSPNADRSRRPVIARQLRRRPHFAKVRRLALRPRSPVIARHRRRRPHFAKVNLDFADFQTFSLHPTPTELSDRPSPVKFVGARTLQK